LGSKKQLVGIPEPNQGGIIRVDDAEFLNCREGIRFFPYKKFNLFPKNKK